VDRKIIRPIRTGLLAAALLAAASGAAFSAIAPWYPRDDADSCKVVAGAELHIDVVPPSWFERMIRGSGWVGQDPRVYTVPPALYCGTHGVHRKSNWACAPTFLPWAKRNCAGLEIKQ